MTRVSIFVNANDEYLGYSLQGHAMFAPNGSDIVCAALSALAISTANSIEMISGQVPETDMDQDEGILCVTFPWEANYETGLFMKSFELAVNDIAKQYKDNVSFKKMTIN